MYNALEPDVDDETIDDRARQRRRTATAVGVAAAALLIAGAVYGVMESQHEGSGQTAQPPSATAQAPSAATPPTYTNDGARIEPGRYRMVFGMDGNELPMQADLTFGGHTWLADNYPVLADMGGVAVYQPLALAAGTGCLSDPPNTDVGDTPQAIAARLAQLPDSTVIQAPAPMQAFGQNTVHLQERIDQHCGADVYRVALTMRGGHGISYGDTTREVLIDFWVMDLSSGDPVVVETWHQAGTPGQLVDQITATRDSIKFVTSG
jgi:hypothetical protein